jgi:tetratricopeptide (TPR) repeat protein
MRKFITLKKGLKLALVLSLLAVAVAAVLLGSVRSDNTTPLTDVLEGGESAMTAVGRSYESLTSFVKNDNSLAMELLTSAHQSQESASTKLTYASRTSDSVVLSMAQNYDHLLNSSHVITDGVDNLLTISEDLEKTLYHYRQGEYDAAAAKATVCLQTLNPLVEHIETLNQTLNKINYRYVAASHVSRVKYAVDEYRNASKIYLDYVSLLKSIQDGVEYLKTTSDVNDLMDQLQQILSKETLTAEDYQKAQRIMQEISQLLQQLKTPSYQQAASTASEIDPNLFEGSAYNTALNLQNLLQDLGGIEQLEKYLQSTSHYVDALNYSDQGDYDAANVALMKGLELLGDGQTLSDTYIERLFSGLRNAYSTLKQRLKGQPDIS